MKKQLVELTTVKIPPFANVICRYGFDLVALVPASGYHFAIDGSHYECIHVRINKEGRGFMVELVRVEPKEYFMVEILAHWSTKGLDPSEFSMFPRGLPTLQEALEQAREVLREYLPDC